MDKKIILLSFSFLIFSGLCAQENATQAINEIKQQSDIYLYAESTSQTWEEALENAQYLLEVEIESWVKSFDSSSVDGYIAKAQHHIFHLKSMRGDRFRAFVYVKKGDIAPVSNTERLVVVPMDESQQTTIQDVTASVPTTEPLFHPSAFEDEMMSITDARNIGTFITRLKSEGRICNYGKYKDMPTNIDCYLFVYNRDMQIPAYLHKQGNGYVNLKTGKQDQVTNYTGCGAWWFQLK